MDYAELDIQTLQDEELAVFVACVLYRHYGYCHRYVAALEQANLASRYVPPSARAVKRYGDALWEKLSQEQQVSVPTVKEIDPNDQVDFFEFWACFVLQLIEEFVTLAEHPSRTELESILNQSRDELEQLADAFSDGLLRSTSASWPGPEAQEQAAARTDRDTLQRDGVSAATELRERWRDHGSLVQFADPRFPGGWGPVP